MEQQLWLLLVICSVSLLEAYSTDNCTQIVPPNNCTKFDHNCSLCVLNEGCGYCQNYGQCVPGDSIGPNIKGYCCDVWSNSENSCLESVCSGHGSCDACSKLVYCNWCESSNLCMPGGIFGPYVNHSLCSDWRWAHCGGCMCKQFVISHKLVWVSMLILLILMMVLYLLKLLILF
eukprot:TRINITY_DN4204_c0_g1_i2.p1 TRINITY_DN4204_c0_g1~~TRINITY_DN4204_c0_g1_i2.p1  ORF type:complete len:175 (-),score=9.82 TRINITY_DN4204_c0_g1_i2:45-569(-)